MKLIREIHVSSGKSGFTSMVRHALWHRPSKAQWDTTCRYCQIWLEERANE